MEYKIEFTHTEESKYYAVIEADSKEEAIMICESEPFDHLESEEPHEVNGIDVEVNREDIEEI